MVKFVFTQKSFASFLQIECGYADTSINIKKSSYD